MNPLPSLSALQERNEHAWAQLADLLFPKALEAARTKLYGEFKEDPRDASQRGLYRLVEKIDTVTSVDDLPALLTTIVYAEAIDFLRRQNASKRGGGRVFRFGVLEEWFEADGFDGPADGALPVDEAHVPSLAEIVRKLSAVLSPKVRELLIDRYYWHKTAPEIAAARGMKEGAVRTALPRGGSDLHGQLCIQSRLYQEIRILLQIPANLMSAMLAFL